MNRTRASPILSAHSWAWFSGAESATGEPLRADAGMRHEAGSCTGVARDSTARVSWVFGGMIILHSIRMSPVAGSSRYVPVY